MKSGLLKMFSKFTCLCAAAVLTVCCAGCAPSESAVPVPEKNGHKLVWSDEFDGNTLDMQKWSYQTGTRDYYGETVGANYWGNDEMQYYTDGANLSVSDGVLTITAKRENKGDRQFTSSRIITRDKFSQTYGYFEASMKLPAHSGMWPAFWLLPQPTDKTSSDNVYGGWAANGELDIMEAKGRLPNQVDTTLHFGGKWPQNEWKGHTTELSSPIDEWHTYAVDWREDHISWIIDEEEVYRLAAADWRTSASSEPSAPFDQPFFILINLAVGGKYDGYVQPAEGFTQAHMYVDYVRVYE